MSMSGTDAFPTADPRPRVAPPRAGAPLRRADRALVLAGTAWCGLAVAGQLLFAAYVLGFYGRSAATGQLQAWNKVMPHGYVPGNSIGNAAVALHLACAAIVMLGGGLQLVPALRRAAPAAHRWIGRTYILAATATAIDGVGMVWLRGTVGDLSQHLAITLNAALILLFGGLAWQRAHTRRFAEHRRWALRLYLAAAGVWFFRIGLMAWLVLNRGPVGFDPKTFAGPTLTVLAFAQYLLPLAVLEAWLRVRDGGSVGARFALSATFVALTLLTALGIFAAAKIFWLPHM